MQDGAESSNISDAASKALIRFKDMLVDGNPRVISSRSSMCWHLFTDASHEPQASTPFAGVGAVLVDGMGNKVRVLLADPAVSLTLVKPAQRTRVVSYYMYGNQPLFLQCAMHVLHLRLPHPPLHLSVPHFETKRESCDASSSSVPLAVCSTLSWT